MFFMALSIVGLLLILVSVGCFVPILLHAFQRSLGTGFMVLCIPVYPLVYGFTQFEHAKKGLLLAGWLGLFVLGVVLRFLGPALLAS
jgi:translocator protein